MLFYKVLSNCQPEFCPLQVTMRKQALTAAIKKPAAYRSTLVGGRSHTCKVPRTRIHALWSKPLDLNFRGKMGCDQSIALNCKPERQLPLTSLNYLTGFYQSVFLPGHSNSSPWFMRHIQFNYQHPGTFTQLANTSTVSPTVCCQVAVSNILLLGFLSFNRTKEIP